MTRLLTALLAVVALPVFAQYNQGAGSNAPAAQEVKVEKRAADGTVRYETERREAPRDAHGNAAGSTYDLAVDGAFSGQTVLVIDLYGQDFSHPTAAVGRKGFSVVRYREVPSLEVLEAGLKKANQFWILASCENRVHLPKTHQLAVKRFFEAGHGVYLWGDNDPCNADADALATMLIDARVQGDLPGDRTVGISRKAGEPGVARDHLLSTGVEQVYEGITVATVKPAGAMTPVIYGSAGNLVSAAYEANGRRLIVDGGYTRLSYKWDTAGTGRYVMNAAAWLANFERFGDTVVAGQFKKK